MRDPETWANFDPDIIEVDQHQIPEPELGPLERRVESTFEEALFSDDISLADTEYWFTEPPGMCSLMHTFHLLLASLRQFMF